MILTPTKPKTQMEKAGQAANQAAAAAVFEDYQARRADNTLRRQAADLVLFAEFLAGAGVPCGDLYSNPEAWQGVTWGIVKAFQAWQLQQGYSLASINGRLSTVRVYAGLAAQADWIDPRELVLINSVKGYAHKECVHINEKRTTAGIEIRVGAKKAEAVSVSVEQADTLFDRPDTPQGRRDRLLMLLLLRLGLRVGEVAALTVDCFDLKAGELRFYRPKVAKTQTHKLDRETLTAARAYLARDAPALGPVWRKSASRRDGKARAGELTGAGLSARAITKRVRVLGEKAGLTGLSAHDLRHFWATQAARNKTPMDRLKDAGGWNSLAMPGRYIEAAKIANEGVRLE